MENYESDSALIDIQFDTEWEVNLKVINMEYLRTHFLFDFFTCVPLIITGE